MPPPLHLSYDQIGGCIAAKFNVSTADLAINTADPNYTDVLTVQRQSNNGKFLVRFACIGTNFNGDITAMCRVLVDGVITNFCGGYGNRISTAINNRALAVHGMALITGLSPRIAHTFKLQAAFRTTAWNIQAASNPGLERGWLVVAGA